MTNEEIDKFRDLVNLNSVHDNTVFTQLAGIIELLAEIAKRLPDPNIIRCPDGTFLVKKGSE